MRERGFDFLSPSPTLQYMQDVIKEEIDVIYKTLAKKLSPVKFKWGNREYKVDKVIGSWKNTLAPGRYSYHYALECGTDDVYEVSYIPDECRWTLDRIVNLPGDYQFDRN